MKTMKDRNNVEFKPGDRVHVPIKNVFGKVIEFPSIDFARLELENGDILLACNCQIIKA